MARRIVLIATIVSAALAAMTSPAQAFVYWANAGTTIGRASPNGHGATQSFISGANQACGVAVDSKYIYWTNAASGTIGRAKLDGTHINQRFITGANNPCGLAVDLAHIYWANDVPTGTIGRASRTGTSPNQNFVKTAAHPCGVAVDSTHVYWGNRDAKTIGRASLDGTGRDQNFIATANGPCGVAVNKGYVFWANSVGGTTIGRATIDGSGVDQNFIPASGPSGPAVDGGHIYWANSATGTVGRADLDGTSVNQSFISGASKPTFVAVDLPPLLVPHNTTIIAVDISSKARHAIFSFTAGGVVSGFQCALIKPTAQHVKKKRKKHKPRFKPCTSPKGYTNLTPGSYTFEVRAVNAAGHDPAPAVRKFTI